MRRTGPVAALVAVAVVVAAVPAGGVAQSTAAEATTPGERLAGVVGVQGAEIDAAVEERTFAERLHRADSNASKASVAGDRLNRTRERLRALADREATLRRARANGSISQGEYSARMAWLAAETRAVERSLNTTAAATRTLPNETRRSHGVDDAAIARLRTRASNLTGPEIAALARGIAGQDVGGPPSGLPAQAGSPRSEPPTDRGNASTAGDGGPPTGGNASNGEAGRENGTAASATPGPRNGTDANASTTDRSTRDPDRPERAADERGGSGSADERGSNDRSGSDPPSGSAPDGPDS